MEKKSAEELKVKLGDEIVVNSSAAVARSDVQFPQRRLAEPRYRFVSLFSANGFKGVVEPLRDPLLFPQRLSELR